MDLPRLLVLLAAMAIGGFRTDAAEKPNIVFILADDLGYGDLGCYGQKTLTTPNLDQLAAEGMRFTRHYAGMTVCSPSRCVLMTGKHSGRTPVRTNWDPPMPDGTATLASVLKGAGYATGAFGKWGIGNVIPEDDPLRKGFDTFYGYVDMFHAHNFFPPFLVRNGKRDFRVSLVPVLLGRPADQKHHEFLYFEFYEGGGKQAMVTDRWKAVRLNWNEQPEAPLELYDLQNDLAEAHNVAGQHPDLIRVMNERLAQSHTDHPGKTPPPTWGFGKPSASQK